ncbi:UDP-N-acetylmuramoyl-tripeptide--D-alanyl-D-alanine ligase [Paenibacillus mesophilus]|uniref:UDP-N-acetylmuramoyl-tripeptide--D-alanyl-D- alanine ligase n=1 Tax=Paenibacillus mesophilus TaxID=2582849 RepID=UPI00110EDD9D|nr:UDP-N-acetylmuramoyl-tripeptide--D-alanyl-D-alanine ligase [Paenibacillus mesophilus]TMV51604.1 UDP-N-acetylmuramoyl-tripeptide--D-alanyl-D-alanine ligase [Paenibacillus mesophilus]
MEETIIRGVSIDSRTIRTGSLFIPLVREKDGHDYVGEAIRNGAAAVLWQSDHPDPPERFPVIVVDDCLTALQTLAGDYRSRLPVKVIGITGSNGKTTTKDMIESIVGTTYKVHKTKGNLNSQIGVPLTLLDMAPDVEYAVIEMGMSERGQIERLSRMVRPDIAVITMIGVSHLSSLGSREQIAAAKMEIVRGMKDDAVLVYNGDEPLLAQQLAALQPLVRTVSFGMSEHSRYRAFAVESDENGVSFQLHSEPYRIPMLGKHNVTNALASIAAAELTGVSTDRVKRGLERLTVTGMRMEVTRAAAGYTVINDAWNASPVSVKAAIETFGELQGFSNKFLVVGDMRELGEDERRYHREIGRMLDPDTIQYVYTVGELAEEIASEAAKRFPEGRVLSFRRQEDAIRTLRSAITAADAVLVKGSRGLEMEQIVFALS